MGKTFEAMERAEQQSLRLKPAELPSTQALLPDAAKDLRFPQRWGSLECYESLRSGLTGETLLNGKRTILFVGTREGDGASTSALGFSLCATRDPNVRILLIDIDLRKPTLHTALGVSNTPGLFEYITNGEWDPHIQECTSHNIHLLAGGSCTKVSNRLLESGKFDAFLRRMKSEFDYVILDGPPVLDCSGARSIAAKVDHVILVLRAGATRRQVALRAKKELQDAGAHVLGVILNRRRFHIPGCIYRRL